MSESTPEAVPTQEAAIPPRPQIYLASLSDYNAGRLHGVWIDVAVEREQVARQVEAMLATSAEPHAEEWAIHDYQGFGALDLSEYESLEMVAAIGRAIAEHGLAFAAYVDHVGLHEIEGLAGFADAYLGQWASTVDYAEQLLDDMGATEALAAIPAWLQGHIQLDVAGFARDLELGGDIWTAADGDGGVWVFDGHC